MRRPRGFTLAEVLTAASLLGLVLLLGMNVLTPSLRIWNLGQACSTVEGAALLLERRMTNELLASSRRSVTSIRTGPTALSFLESRNRRYDAATGRVQWTGFVVYTLDTTSGKLVRKTWPNPALSVQTPALAYSFPTTRAVRLTDAELQQVARTANGTESTVGLHVADVNILSATNSEPLPLILRMNLLTQTGIQVRERRLELSLRN